MFEGMRMHRRLAHWARTGFLAGLALAASGLLLLAPVPAMAQAQQAPAQAAQPAPDEPTQPQAKAVLSKFGNFVQHPRYGEVWVPTVTPQGWHPYPPCMWVRTKQYGWYFDDKTEWGAIVHHYGRWVHDPQLGWIWDPGSEFSPGWVVWRTSKDYIGWAPMLPPEDVQTTSIATFDNSDQWLFMDVGKFGKACSGDVLVPPAQIVLILQKTTYVTEIEFVDGIVIFVLPPWIIGEYVDIEINFNPWQIYWFTQIIIDWNWIWHHTTIYKTIKVCTPTYPTGAPPGPIKKL